MLDVIKGDYKDSVQTLVDLTLTVQQLLLSLTIDPRLIFSVDHPELPFFEKMKMQLWDYVDKITEKFILVILKDVNELVRAQHVGDPPCFAAYKGYEKSLGILCRGIIRNVNAFWTALGFCLWMFLVLGTVSHFLSKYFLRMVNWTYDGSEVESYSSTSSSSSATQSGSSSPKVAASKMEATHVPAEHATATEASADAVAHTETPKDGLKDTQCIIQPQPRNMHPEFPINGTEHRFKELQQSNGQAAEVYYVDDVAYTIKHRYALADMDNEGDIVLRILMELLC
ncbi:hypothetical protein MTO96_025859 [Rhipicephalus appendiculatus]